MKKNKTQTSEAANSQQEDGYPVYPSREDIYRKGNLEEAIDPEDISKNKETVIISSEDEPNELDFTNGVTGDDLDIPGAELDDEDELIGSEDEENNSYSIGGDNHNDLEEERE